MEMEIQAKQSKRERIRDTILATFPEHFRANTENISLEDICPVQSDDLEYIMSTVLNNSANVRIIRHNDKPKLLKAFKKLATERVVVIMIASPYITISAEKYCYVIAESWMDTSIMKTYLEDNTRRIIIHNGAAFKKHFQNPVPFVDTMELFTILKDVPPRDYTLHECLDMYDIVLPPFCYETDWQLEEGAASIECMPALRAQFCNLVFVLYDQLNYDFLLHGCLLKRLGGDSSTSESDL